MLSKNEARKFSLADITRLKAYVSPTLIHRVLISLREVVEEGKVGKETDRCSRELAVRDWPVKECYSKRRKTVSIQLDSYTLHFSATFIVHSPAVMSLDILGTRTTIIRIKIARRIELDTMATLVEVNISKRPFRRKMKHRRNFNSSEGKKQASKNRMSMELVLILIIIKV